MQWVYNELYYFPQRVGYQDQRITVTNPEISEMIREADLNTDQEYSSCVVDSELQSYFDYVVQNENIAYPPDHWIEKKNMHKK